MVWWLLTVSDHRISIEKTHTQAKNFILENTVVDFFNKILKMKRKWLTNSQTEKIKNGVYKNEMKG